MNIELLEKLIAVSAVSSVLAMTFIQETKGAFKSSKSIKPYSIIVNAVIGILFTLSFTEYNLENGAWVGFLSFVGADGLYKTLEGKLKPFKAIKEETIEIERKDK